MKLQTLRVSRSRHVWDMIRDSIEPLTNDYLIESKDVTRINHINPAQVEMFAMHDHFAPPLFPCRSASR